MTPFESLLRKKLEETDTDIDYYLETIRKYPEGEWLFPTSADGANDFRIFFELYTEQHMVGIKIMPVWVNGSYRGQKLYFMYKEDLKYDT